MAKDIKKFENIAIADVKSVNGIANADIKSINGVDNVSDSIILFEDDFKSTSLDTDEWTLDNTNPTFTIVSYTMDGLEIDIKESGLGTYAQFSADNSHYNFNGEYAVTFDLKASDTDQMFGVRFCDSDFGVNSMHQLYYRDYVITPDHDIATILRNSSSTFLVNTTQTDGWVADTFITYKLSYKNETAYWSYWNGSSWTVFKSYADTGGFIASLEAMYFRIYGHTGFGSDSVFTIKNFFICNEDFDTQYPT